MRKLIGLVLALSGAGAFAGVDYSCVNDCTAKNYQYNYCVQACSFDDPWQTPQQQPRQKQTDYVCVNDCTKRGYLYNYCVERCSY